MFRPIKKSRLFTAFLMSFIMSSTVSAVVTYANLRTFENFFHTWLEAAMIAVPVAFFVLLLIRPIIEGFAKRIFEDE